MMRQDSQRACIPSAHSYCTPHDAQEPFLSTVQLGVTDILFSDCTQQTCQFLIGIGVKMEPKVVYHNVLLRSKASQGI